MGYTNLLRLETLRKLNANQTWVNSDLYRLLYKPELYIVAYERIKSNPGNMTPGIDGSTLDGFSMKTIENIVSAMRDESFQFSPALRKYIQKNKSKESRPLGITTPKDKVVQQVIRLILEAIYDSPYGSTFRDVSHGFRPGRGCHTALKEIRKWSGVNWVIEGDVKSCFDAIDHEILISRLRDRIRDERFLNLIRKALRAGYMEFYVPVDSIIGTPQGSVLSPILSNVYMHEFDLFMEKLIEKYSKGTERAINPEYRKHYKARQYRQKKLEFVKDPVEREGLVNEIHRLRKEMNKFPSLLPNDKDFIRIKYVRYGDDWIIAVTGSKELANNIRKEINEFLANTLKLTLNPEKNHIRHAKTEEAFFLGSRIKFGGGDAKVTLTQRGTQNFKRRSTGWNSVMLAPVENLVYRLYKRGICDSQGNPMQKASWAVMDDVQIVEKYNSILWGILNYYSFVNHYHNLSRIQYILQYSAAKTLANKHKSSLRKVFKKCGRSLTVCFMKNGEALKKSLRLETSWCTRPNRFHTNGKTYNGPDGIVKTHWRLRTRSKLEEPCAVCGSDTTVEMHHVRHIRKIGYKTTGFSRIMAGLNRKQIPVCSECHEGIHAGRYDGHNLKYLIPSSLPAS